MIKVLHYERVNKNKVIGYLDIEVIIGGISHIFRKINHIQQGNKRWFNYPTFRRPTQGEETEYLPFHEFGVKIHNTQLLDALHDVVEKYCLENKISPIPILELESEEKELHTLWEMDGA
jgi:hypothetical protein